LRDDSYESSNESYDEDDEDSLSEEAKDDKKVFKNTAADVPTGLQAAPAKVEDTFETSNNLAQVVSGSAVQCLCGHIHHTAFRSHQALPLSKSDPVKWLSLSDVVKNPVLYSTLSGIKPGKLPDLK
jgi:hypothetical protein